MSSNQTDWYVRTVRKSRYPFVLLVTILWVQLVYHPVIKHLSHYRLKKLLKLNPDNQATCLEPQALEEPSMGHDVDVSYLSIAGLKQSKTELIWTYVFQMDESIMVGRHGNIHSQWHTSSSKVVVPPEHLQKVPPTRDQIFKYITLRRAFPI